MESLWLIKKLTEKITRLFLASRFEDAITEMDAAIESLQQCATFRDAGIGNYRSVRQDQEITAMVPSEGHTRAIIVYPYIYLPYDN